MAFACRLFYTSGRAVPWFNTILSPLKISASAFFADFAEWTCCNNCSFDSGFVPEDASYLDIQKMQLLFLEQKYEEKHKSHLFTAVSDLIKIHGAFSMISAGECDNKDGVVVELSYSPDDLLSPVCYNIVHFCDTVTMEPCVVRVYASSGMPVYSIVN